MAYRLLVIEGDNGSVGQLVRQDVWSSAGDCSIDRFSWSSFKPASLVDCGADLLVPIAVREEPPVLDLFTWLREHPVRLPTLAILSEEADGAFLKLAAESVDDFILGVSRTVELEQRIARILGSMPHNLVGVRRRLVDETGLAGLVGRDPTFLKTLEKIPLVARTVGPVLITGETGTGKEVCARAIHHVSGRRSSPFIPVDCGAIPEHLVENELFGHVRGAYTDARQDQRGLIAMAEGGTIFLDEVDTLSTAAQAKEKRSKQERR